MRRQATGQLTPRSPMQPKDRDKVKVMLRIRPFQSSEQQQQFLVVQDQNTVMVNKPGYPTYMKFSYVQSQNITKLSKQSSQQSMFCSVKQAVECIFQGVDSTIFAYGQTGAGKTYTIVGNCPQLNSDSQNYRLSLLTDERGILPRALERVFEQQIIKKDSRITISFFEIYNQKIFDLLNSGIVKPLEIRQVKGGELNINGLSFVEVVSMKEVINYLAEGIKNRATSSTQGNMKSSRSHSIFHVKYQRLILNSQTSQHQVLVANLRIVDLAGSQKFNVPHDCSPAQKQIKSLEIKSINGSLSKLGHCISALTSQTRSHIPFRDSKLTRILSDSLLGSGKIRLIICASPSISSMNQTSSTLQFADRVKKAIFQRPTLSIQKKKTIDIDQFRQLQKQLEIQKLKRVELEGMVREFLKAKDCKEGDLLKENYKLRQQVVMLKEQIKIYSQNIKLGGQQQQLQTQLQLQQLSKQTVMKSIKNNTSIIKCKTSSTTPNNIISHKPSSSIINNQRTSQNLSPSRMRTSQLKPNQSIQAPAGKMMNRTMDKIATQKFIKTPPKTSATKSVHDNQSQQRISCDGSPSPYHHQNLKQRSRQFVGKKTATTTTTQFQKSIKKFMASSQNDRQLQQKVRRRLHQIKKQLIQTTEMQHEEDGGFLVSDVERLWRK